MVKQTEHRKQTELNHKQLEKLLLLKCVRCAATGQFSQTFPTLLKLLLHYYQPIATWTILLVTQYQ